MASDPRPARRALLCRATCALALALTGAPTPGQPVPEPEMKAAFVFNFAVFTQWPGEALAPGAPLTLCARPQAALYPALAALADKTVNGHRLAVRAWPAAATACHILFLDRQDRDRWDALRHELAGHAVLTVSDDRQIGSDGAVIGLDLDHRRIAFDVDLGAARGAHLVLSSKLLRLARSVQ